MHQEGLGSKATSASETTFEDSKETEMETDKQADDLKTPPEEVKDEEVVTEKDVKASQDEEDDMEYPHGPKLWIILSALCLAVFLVALDQTVCFAHACFSIGYQEIPPSKLCKMKKVADTRFRSSLRQSQRSQTISRVFKI